MYHQGDITGAEQQAYEALQIIVEAQGLIISYMFALVANAFLLAQRGNEERAVELYALASCYSHVANSVWFEDIVGQHITATAAATLTPEAVAAAKARGQSLDLHKTAIELLAELAELGWTQQPIPSAIHKIHRL
jgi:hypothetical protein